MASKIVVKIKAGLKDFQKENKYKMKWRKW
jgi:hypothetical protein